MTNPLIILVVWVITALLSNSSKQKCSHPEQNRQGCVVFRQGCVVFQQGCAEFRHTSAEFQHISVDFAESSGFEIFCLLLLQSINSTIGGSMSNKTAKIHSEVKYSRFERKICSSGRYHKITVKRFHRSYRKASKLALKGYLG